MTDTQPDYAEDGDAVMRVGAVSASGGPAESSGDLHLTGSVDAVEKITEFDTIVADHESALLRYARHQLGKGFEGRHHDAQDIVQEALLRLHRQWKQDGLASLQNIRAWLMRVTHNLVVDAIRKRSRQREARLRLHQDAVETSADLSSNANSLETMESHEAKDHALRLMHDLPDTQQRVLMLRLNDLTVREIAEVLNMSPGNVGYHMNQAMMTLTRQMKQAGLV